MSMTVNQISVFIENKAGSLSAFAHLLRENGIDMRALSIADVEDYGILRIIVDDVYKTSTVLKNAEYVFKITTVLAVPLKDAAGSLADALDVLGTNTINIEYLYAFVGRQRHRAYVIFRVADEDVERATQVLTSAGYAPVSQDDLQLDTEDAR